MSDKKELEKLYGKSKEFLIGEAKIVLTPLSMDDMSLAEVPPNATVSEQKDVTLKLLAKSMDADIEDVKKISVEYLKDIFNHIMKINNFEDEAVQKLKDSLGKNELPK